MSVRAGSLLFRGLSVCSGRLGCGLVVLVKLGLEYGDDVVDGILLEVCLVDELLARSAAPRGR